jgi:hypothetical protein
MHFTLIVTRESEDTPATLTVFMNKTRGKNLYGTEPLKGVIARNQQGEGQTRDRLLKTQMCSAITFFPQNGVALSHV